MSFAIEWFMYKQTSCCHADHLQNIICNDGRFIYGACQIVNCVNLFVLFRSTCMSMCSSIVVCCHQPPSVVHLLLSFAAFSPSLAYLLCLLFAVCCRILLPFAVFHVIEGTRHNAEEANFIVAITCSNYTVNTLNNKLT